MVFFEQVFFSQRGRQKQDSHSYPATVDFVADVSLMS